MFCIAVGQIRRMHRHNRGRHSAHAEERGEDRLRQQRSRLLSQQMLAQESSKRDGHDNLQKVLKGNRMRAHHLRDTC